MTLIILINTLFAVANLKWSRDAFLDHRQGWGWFHLAISAWCTAMVLLDIL